MEAYSPARASDSEQPRLKFNSFDMEGEIGPFNHSAHRWLKGNFIFACLRIDILAVEKRFCTSMECPEDQKTRSGSPACPKDMRGSQ